MFDLLGGEPTLVPLTLYTDSFVIKGQFRTRQARITDMLNHADDDFLVLSDAVIDEYGSRNVAIRSEYAQVNLGAVLFAVADTEVEARPDLRTPKVAEQAMISIPPFRVIGRVHLLPERDLREALTELTGRFIPVTEATFWSESIGEARATAPMVAINHTRAQILAPHREVDPWAGLDRSGEAGEAGLGGASAETAGADSAGRPVQYHHWADVHADENAGVSDVGASGSDPSASPATPGALTGDLPSEWPAGAGDPAWPESDLGR
ncbi:MAG TPA: hypothetical protein VH440_02500 [Candidatus Limnocylindrales bacterium]